MRPKFLGMIFIILIVVVLRIPSLEQPFDNDSGANAYHARLIVRGEPLYTTHHPQHQLPGIYYTYALAFVLFGDGVWSVKALLILWVVVTVAAVYRLGDLVMGHSVGLLGALFYAILSSHIFLFGTTAQNEVFANLPLTAAVLLLLIYVKQNAAPWKFSVVGFLSSICFLFRAVFLSPLLLALVVFSLKFFLSPRGRENIKRRAEIVKFGWIIAGFILGLLPVIGYFGLLGALPRLLLVFKLGQYYLSIGAVGTVSLWGWITAPFLALGFNNAALLIYGLLSCGEILGRALKGLRSAVHPLAFDSAFGLAIWFILSLGEANVSKSAFLHYYQLVVPSLAVLAALFVVKMRCDLFVRRGRASTVAASMILVIALLLPIGLSVQQNFHYYREYIWYRIGLSTLEDFTLKGWPALGQILVRTQDVADYISRQTDENDLIYYWSNDVQVYYLADRRCAIDIIWPLYVGVTGPPQRIFSPQTKYIILGEAGNSPPPEWLYEGLARSYVLETEIAGESIYRWVDWQADYVD